jgi:hypothetical protein
MDLRNHKDFLSELVELLSFRDRIEPIVWSDWAALNWPVTSKNLTKKMQKSYVSKRK